MKEYEAAAHRFYNSLQVNSLPISSWDIFSTYFGKLCLSYTDVLLLTNLAKTNQWTTHVENIDTNILEEEYVVVVTDATLNIVHATSNIEQMNGYTPEEILGNKPKMFQGKETSKATTAYIANAIKSKTSFETEILNYKKDGSIYNCYIKGFPIFNKKGTLINFIAYEKEVA